MSSCVQFAYVTGGASVNHGAGANLNITGALTIDAWLSFMTNPSASMSAIVLHGINTGYYFVILSVGGVYKVGFNKAGVLSYYSALALVQPGKKHHVAIVWNGVNNTFFYVDGILRDTWVNAGAIIGEVANSYVSYPDRDWGYKGCIFNLNIYNRALTATEILYNKEHPNNAIRQGRQLGVTQESIVGGVWKDLSPNGYDGTFVATTIGQTNNLAGRNVSL